MPEQSKIVEVRVIPQVDKSRMSEDDADLPQIVEVEIKPYVAEKWVANAALDAFHSTFGVDCLDDFEFEVWHKNQELAPDISDYAPEDYSLQQYTKVL